MNFYTQIARIGNSIVYRGYRDGKRVSFREPYGPTFFIPSKNPNAEWKTLEGSPVDPMKFESMKEASDFLKRYEGVEDITIHGNTNFSAQYIQEKFPDTIKYDPKVVKVANIDIEVESDDGFPEPDKANHTVQSICLKYFDNPAVFIWALEDKYDPAKTELDIDPENIYFIKCGGEVDLLLKFLSFWSSKDTSPDIVTGWNVKGFDIPYLVNRVAKMIGPDSVKKFSPWQVVREKNVSFKGKTQQVYEIVGIETLDYYDLFQKFGFLSYGVLESYKLDHVAFTVLGEKKLSYEEFGNLFTLYKEDYQKFIDYNIKDVLLVEQIDEKMGLIDLAMTIAYKGGCNYQEAFGTTQLWDTYIYRELCDRKMVVPQKVERPNTPIAGGYVKAPHIGRHSWVVSFDLNSLYPNIMVQANMSPETVSNDRREGVTVDRCLSMDLPGSEAGEDLSLAANGVQFTKEKQGVIPRIIDGLYAERKVVKNDMLKDQQELDNIERELKRRGIL